MDNKLNKKKLRTGLGILFLWIFTVCLILGKFGLEIDNLQRDIVNHKPVLLEEPHGVKEYLPREQTFTEVMYVRTEVLEELAPRDYGSHIQYKESENYMLREEYQEMQEKQEELKKCILLTIPVCVYLVLGIVGFVLLRRKEQLRTLLFLGLIIINLVVLSLIPISPVTR